MLVSFVLLFTLPLRTNAESLAIQLQVFASGSVKSATPTAACAVGGSCPSLISALHKAEEILNTSINGTIRRTQVELMLLAGKHYIPYGTVLSNISQSISLVGKGHNTTHLMCKGQSNDDTAAAISFFSFQKVILKWLTVTGCTKAVAGGAVFMVKRGGNLFIDQCHFRNNAGVAVLAIDVTYVNISWSTFSSSTHVSNMSAGIHATYSQPVHSNTLSVSHCHFESLTYLPVVTSNGRQLGAGISVVLNTDNSLGNIQMNVTITHSSFVSNNANSGAGIYFRIDQIATSFKIKVDNCQFNKCSIAQAETQKTLERGHGGGLVLVLHGRSQGVMEILNSNFSTNSAMMGAALAVLYFDEVQSTDVTMINSLFYNNMATSTGAVAFFNSIEINQWSQRITMRDIKLENNIGGAVVIDGVDAYLEGYVIIAGNKGSAVQVQNGAWLVVRDSVKFIENTGRNGAALKLSNSQLMLDDSADVLFANNKASNEGGAIWVSTSEIVGVESMAYHHSHNSMCFIRSAPQGSPSLNRTNYGPLGNIKFINNRAKQAGGAIYTNSIDGCSWSEETNSYQAAAVFFLPNFLFKNNSRQNITSGATKLSAILKKHKNSRSKLSPPLVICDQRKNAYCVIPGIAYKLSVTSIDGMHNPVSTKFTVSSNTRYAVRIMHHNDEL
jgi:predicted outer membrane repeat protein